MTNPPIGGSVAEQEHLWAGQNQMFSDAVAVHDFNNRERLLLTLLRLQTYGAKRVAVYIDQLATFSDAVEISRGNVSSILKRLKACLVIEERPDCFYGFLEPVDNWKVPRRLKLFSIGQQLELIQEEPHISDVLRVLFQERQGIPGRQPGATSASRSPIGVALQPCVPESGTQAISKPFPNRERPSLRPTESAVLGTIPESGTAHVTCNMQQCSNAPAKEHTNIVTSVVVPESGTEQLVPGKQDLLNQLRLEGAFTDRRDDHSRPCWLGMVRKRPSIVAELIGELRYARHSRCILNPGAWMMDKWKRWGRPDH